MIPANRVHPAAVRNLVDYLVAEFARAKSERSGLEMSWISWHEAYRAKVSEEQATFPFLGAAKLKIPVIATDLDTIFARLMAHLFSVENLWTCVATRDDMIDFAARAQEFLETMQHSELDLQGPIADWLLETAKLGTGILKTRYERQQKKVYEFREMQSMGGQPQTFERQARILLKDRPAINHVSLWDFYVPANSNNLVDAPWCGERINLTWPMFLNRVRAGIYTMPANLGSWWANNRGHQVERHMQELDQYVPSMGDKLAPVEFWLDFDIDLDGEPEALVATIHEESRSLLRLDFNPFFNQEKPYDFARYLRQEKRFYGIGLCEMLFPFQEEISTMHNQRLDATTIEIMPIFKALNTGLVKVDEPLFPGRIVMVDNMEDFAPVGMNVSAPSTIQNETITLQYARSRSGVTDYIEGSADNGANYATATMAVQQLREGAKRFDQVMREIRPCLDGVGTKTLELYQQFNQGGKPYLAMGQKDGEMVSRFLQFPTDIIRSGVQVRLTATSAQQNKEVAIRTNMIVMQMLTQYYMQLMQAIATAINPMVPPQLRMIAMQGAEAGTTLLRRIIDEHGLQDADRLVPNLQEALNIGQQQQLNPYGAPIGGGPAMAPGFGQPSGMAALAGVFGSPAQPGALGTQNGAGAGGFLPAAGQGRGF